MYCLYLNLQKLLEEEVKQMKRAGSEFAPGCSRWFLNSPVASLYLSFMNVVSDPLLTIKEAIKLYQVEVFDI